MASQLVKYLRTKRHIREARQSFQGLARFALGNFYLYALNQTLICKGEKKRWIASTFIFFFFFFFLSIFERMTCGWNDKLKKNDPQHTGLQWIDWGPTFGGQWQLIHQQHSSTHTTISSFAISFLSQPIARSSIIMAQLIRTRRRQQLQSFKLRSTEILLDNITTE